MNNMSTPLKCFFFVLIDDCPWFYNARRCFPAKYVQPSRFDRRLCRANLIHVRVSQPWCQFTWRCIHLTDLSWCLEIEHVIVG